MKLTDTQRRQILRGGHPHMALDPDEAKELEPCRITIKQQVWIDVRGAKHDKKAGWYVDYTVCDHRPRFLRRGAGYTHSIALAVDGVEAIPAECQEEFTLEAHRKKATYDREHRLEAVAKQDAQRLSSEIRELTKRAIKMGVDPALALAPIVKLVEEQHRALPRLKDVTLKNAA